MKSLFTFALWFVVASAIDSTLRFAHEALPARYKWLHLDSLAFVVTLYFGIFIAVKLTRTNQGLWFLPQFLWK